MSLPRYAELHCLSNFTFLHGASSPEELVARAAELGYAALAITDECTLSGVVRAHMAAQEAGLKLIIGSRFVLDDGLCVVLLARNRRGYGQLSHLITLARRRAPKGQYQLDRQLLAQQRLDDCLALWIPPTTRINPADGAWLKTLLPATWIAVELLLQGTDRRRLAQLQALGQQLALPLVATGAVMMHLPERRALRDTLAAIRLGCRVDQLGLRVAGNGEQHLRSLDRLAKLYPPSLLEETLEIVARCHFSLRELRYEYPHELVPAGETPSSWLRTLALNGLRQRWPQGPALQLQEQLEKELALVAELQYEHFFLTVHDIVVFARSRDILCQGRGSAANSLICYCLRITEVRPDENDIKLLFERFLSKERNEPPDIDVDFEHERREEVIQYVYKKYGRDRAALAAAVICYRPRSAIRDVAKALGVDEDAAALLSRSVDWHAPDLKFASSAAGAPDSLSDISPAVAKQLIALVRVLIGFPRHLSQHVGGFVISQGPLSELVPVENASMADRTVIQWEKDDLESLGLLKVDVLALGMLTAIRKALDLVSSITGNRWKMEDVPQADPDVYNMIQKADTIGVFQIESRAQMSMLPRLKPTSYYDLVVQIAIVRPGPIQGDMVHPYLENRRNPDGVTYEKGLDEVLRRTLGVPIFQEQVMQIAIVAAGFSGGEADQLRRAMAAWKRKGGLEPFRDKLITGMTARGYSEDFALQIYNQIKGFGEYGFPESHSASFALLAYISSWLKCHYPAAFTCALLNSQPMGFYPPSQLVQDARRHGVIVLPVDVNHSDYDCTLVASGSAEIENSESSSWYLRLGLRLVKGLSMAAAQRIYAARKRRNFRDIQDLVDRSGINAGDRESLAAADALRGLAGDRYRAFWEVAGYQQKLPLEVVAEECEASTSTGQAAASPWPASELQVMLPRPSEAQDILADYNSTGLTLRRHPLALLRARLQPYNVVVAGDLAALPDGSRVKVAGIVTARQRPQTASGVTFISLEDETGTINVVTWARVYERHHEAARYAGMLGVRGILQLGEGGIVHVVATELVDLSHLVSGMTLRSRDFH